MMKGVRAVAGQGDKRLQGNPQADVLSRVAATWVVRIQGSPEERVRRQCDAWRASDPAHDRAYRRAEQAWRMSAALADDLQLNVPVPPARSRHHPRVWLAAACLLVGVLLGVQSGLWPWLPSSAGDFQTRAGEVRTLHLDDGSEVVLGTDSAINIAYSDTERRVLLLRGEAVFTPSPRGEREPRPFVAQAGQIEGEALGTRFMVRRDDAESGWLGVLEHRVAVRAAIPEAHGLMLAEGESASFRAGTVQASERDPIAESDWSRGVLVFRNQPLDAVARRLHQYGAPKTVFVGSAPRTAPVSAVFRLDNLQQAWPTLSDGLALRTVRLPGLLLVY